MNELTKICVYNASLEFRAEAKKAAEGHEYWTTKFHYRVQEELWSQIMNSYGVYMRHRALHLTELRHPGTIDEEGYPTDEYWDYTCFTPMLERMLKRKVDTDPELQLNDYKKYLLQLHPVQIKMEI